MRHLSVISTRKTTPPPASPALTSPGGSEGHRRRGLHGHDLLLLAAFIELFDLTCHADELGYVRLPRGLEGGWWRGGLRVRGGGRLLLCCGVHRGGICGGDTSPWQVLVLTLKMG